MWSVWLEVNQDSKRAVNYSSTVFELWHVQESFSVANVTVSVLPLHARYNTVLTFYLLSLTEVGYFYFKESLSEKR